MIDRRRSRGFSVAHPILCAVFCASVSPSVVQAHDLSVLGDALARGPSQGWQIFDHGDTVTLQNDSAPNGQQLLWTAGPVPRPARSSLLDFTFKSDNPQSSMNFLIGNAAAGETCLLFLQPNRNVGLDCLMGQETTNLALVEGAGSADGRNQLQVIEQGDEVIFFLNKTQVAQMKGRAAQGDLMGVVALGPGTYDLHHFSIYVPPEEGTAPTQAETPAGEMVPDDATNARQLLDSVFTQTSPRAGWTLQDIENGWWLENAANQGDEQSFVLPLPPVGPEEARVTAVDVMIAPPRTGLQSSRASAGLLWESPQTGHSCSATVTAQGDGVLVCFSPNGRPTEIARVKGMVSGPGPHVISVIETATDILTMVGTQQLAIIENHPSLGGEMSVYAYDRGIFHFPELTVQAVAKTPKAPPVETRKPTTSMGEGLAGPLPMFGDSPDRAAAAYMGITRSIFLHELGHALIGELSVPATGPEEDAVDIYSALQMADAAITPTGNARMDALAPQAAGYAALSWYYSGLMSEAQGHSGSNWQDEHTADLKRFRNMFCVIYGANPAGFGPLAQAVQMEERTLARCEEEFRKQNRAWRAVLAPYSRVSPENPDGRLAADTAGAGVEIELRPSKRQVGEYLRQNFGAELTEAAEAVARSFALPRPLKVTYQDCDVVNAWYAPSEGSITMCYEIVEHFAVLISDIEAGTQDGYETATNASVSNTAPQSQPPAPQVMTFDELADVGIPQTLRLFAAPYNGPTPASHPRAQIITTADLAAMMTQGPVAVLDVREGHATESLPAAIRIAGLGGDGSLTDGLQSRVAAFAQEFTKTDPRMPLVLMGAGPEDRASYNAALRIGTAGFNALWYRGGLAAWVANGLPVEPVE